MTRSWFLKNPTRGGVGWHLGEASSELGVAVASAGDKAGNVFHIERFVLGKLWVNLATSFCRYWLRSSLCFHDWSSITFSPHLTPMQCSAPSSSLFCYQKNSYCRSEMSLVYTNSLVVKKLWMVISPLVPYFSWSASFYKCMVLLLMNACHSGELVITQENTFKFEGVSWFNAVSLLFFSSGRWQLCLGDAWKGRSWKWRYWTFVGTCSHQKWGLQVTGVPPKPPCGFFF